MTKRRRKPRNQWLRVLKLSAVAIGSGIGVCLIAIAALWIWAGGAKVPPDQQSWGLTFSSSAAQGLGLDPKQTYQAILDGLSPKRLRLVAYWNQIQPTNGRMDFSDLDYQVSLAEQHHIPYVIAVGRKVPRWPECYTPAWAKKLSQNQQEDKLLQFISATVKRYDHGPNLLRWQIENEPFFQFGDNCPAPNQKLLTDEITMVRHLTNTQIMTTDSGEGSNWLQASLLPDVLGSTLYRVVLNGQGSPFHHFLTPDIYTRHANLIKKLHPTVQKVIISELQAEPWTQMGLTNIPQAYIDETLSHKQYVANIQFAHDVGFSEVYMWGAEWWYYRYLHGDTFYWDTARAAFAASAP